MLLGSLDGADVFSLRENHGEEDIRVGRLRQVYNMSRYPLTWFTLGEDCYPQFDSSTQNYV